MDTFLFLLLFVSVHTASADNYCAFEVDGGATKYYVCPRNEHCCRFGCCMNLALHFYQLWYYWLLVIFLFMLCSGGGWWFRFCRSGGHSRSSSSSGGNNSISGGISSRATAALTSGSSASRYSRTSSFNGPRAHPSNGMSSLHSLHSSSSSASASNPASNLRASSHRQHYHSHNHHNHGGLCPHYRHHLDAHHQQRARILHRTCGQRNSLYYLQRFWKSPHEIHHQQQQQQQLPPSYSTMFFNMFTGGGSSASATTNEGDSTAVVVAGQTAGDAGQGLGQQQQQTNSRVANTNCVYYQLYGPPPSYDSVIQLTSEGVTTTSCCRLLVEPPQSTVIVAPSLQSPVIPLVSSGAEVGSEEDVEGVIEEIVITTPTTGSEDEGRLTCASERAERDTVKGVDEVEEDEQEGEDDDDDDVLDAAAVPLISVECSSAETSHHEERTSFPAEGGGDGG